MGSGILMMFVMNRSIFYFKANVGYSISQKQEKFLCPDYKYLSTKLCIQGYDRNDVEFSL